MDRPKSNHETVVRRNHYPPATRVDFRFTPGGSYQIPRMCQSIALGPTLLKPNASILEPVTTGWSGHFIHRG